MKKLLLAFGLLIAGIVSASAACTGPAVMHDFPGTSFNMTLGTSGTGDCKSLIDADTSSQIHSDLVAPIPAGTNLIGKVGIDQTTPGTTNGVMLTSQYPAGAIPLTASATGTTGATTATLALSASLKTYICSYSVRANATAVTTVQNTVTGVVTATLTHQMWVPANTAGLGVDEQIFNPCVPSSAINTAIAVVSGAPGAGGLVSVTATGYQAP